MSILEFGLPAFGYLGVSRSTREERRSTMRILIALSPLMYREAVAISLHRSRPWAEVTLAPPEELDRQVRLLRPHLLLRDDGQEVSPQTLSGIPGRVEVLYHGRLDANVCLGGQSSRLEDLDTADLLRILDEAYKLMPEQA